MQPPPKVSILRFGVFELDLEAEQLQRAGRIVRLQPQPFKLLCLLVTQAGKLVTRDEIRAALWSGDTFVDFDQGVNFAIRQVREGLGEDAENPVYIQTVPRRGYKFVAPVTEVAGEEPIPLESGTQNLRKVMWANISELQLADERRRKQEKQLRRAAVIVAIAATVLLLTWVLLR